ncbi:MAG: P-loop containing nucleoside triphosphate hydrolase protein [Linnemannia gamsii]|nr:Replication factor C (RF-C) subunit [Mortierella sp. AD032]KAK3841023.1 MAG: P-loop containing nucleoside triphosphate hydrolase protein [Linnemannia gamsii]
MALWVDKHRPTNLDKLDYHTDLSAHLKKLCASGDFPHMLVFGPPGAGKKTRVVAILRELFGPGAEKIKIDQRIFETPSKRKLELNIVSSNYHLEVNPSDVGNYDRVVIQDLLKEVAQTQQVDAAAQKRFKVVVIHEADLLTRDAQAGLRRTMEKYMGNLRIIMCCNTTSKIIGPIQSRCLLVRVGAPTPSEMVKVMHKVVKKEHCGPLPENLAFRLAEESGRNLRRALLMLETAKVQCHPFKDDQEIPRMDWEDFIRTVRVQILKTQTPESLQQVRGQLYELINHCIEPAAILKTLAKELIDKVDGNDIKMRFAQEAAFYEHRLRTGQKAIFHLEAFVAKIMSVYKRHLMSMEM